jgi:branched-chain amino acid aminotransferase
MSLNPPPFAWLGGRIVPWSECVLHVRAPGGFWGANVFEGVRAYWLPDDRQLYAFRLREHLARLRRSMKCVRMTVSYSDEDLVQACLDLVRANEFDRDTHITITGYFDLAETFDPMSQTEAADVHITAVPAPQLAAHGADGIAVAVSSWRRISDDVMPPRIKTGANYHNSRLAHHEAVRNGYDTALFLNQRGSLAEGPGSCLVVVRDGELFTPPGTSGVLEGITLASVAEIARRELGVALKRREIDRTELYVADEAFLCGTMHEVLPVTSVDRIPIGDGTPGPLTHQIHERYHRVVRGNDPAYRAWVTPLYEPATAAQGG